jgi:glycosyltransferase involved in cell wall biosynthesis
VVDDGSTDGSAEVAAGYGARVNVIRQANAGESVARNRGIEASSSEWIALLDGDDVWRPDKLERQLMAAHEADELPACVYSDAYLFDDSGERIGKHCKPEYHRAPDWHVQMLCDWSINPSSALVRRAALDNVRFPVTIRHSEDMIFFLELRARGPFLKIADTLVGYRRNQRNQTASVRHHLESVSSRWQWFQDNRTRFTASETQVVREQLARLLTPTFAIALWTTRDTELARECKRLYWEVYPDPANGDRALRARIYPRWAYRIWDQIRAMRS